MKSIGIIRTLSKYIKFLKESTLKRNVNLMNSLPCKINDVFKVKVKFAAVLCSNTFFSSHITKRWKPWSPNRAQSKLSYISKTLAPWHTYTNTHVHSKGCFLSPWKPERWRWHVSRHDFFHCFFFSHTPCFSFAESHALCLSNDKQDS